MTYFLQVYLILLLANIGVMFINFRLDKSYEKAVKDNFGRSMYYILWPVANIGFFIGGSVNIIYCLKNQKNGQEKRKD